MLLQQCEILCRNLNFTSTILQQAQSSKALTPWRIILKSYMSFKNFMCVLSFLFLHSCLFLFICCFYFIYLFICFKSFPILHNILSLPIRSSCMFKVVSLQLVGQSFKSLTCLCLQISKCSQQGSPMTFGLSLVVHFTLPQPLFPLQPSGHLQPLMLHVVRSAGTKPQQFRGSNEFENNNVGVPPPLPPSHICGLTPHIPSIGEILPQYLPS